MLNVLLVDDEPFIRKGLAVLVDWEARGFCIKGEAANGEEALELLKLDTYDLIIADIKMPGMDGIELLKKIQAEKLSEAKYVILSGFFEYGYAKSAIQYNCIDYILKPVPREELERLLDQVYEDAKERRKKNVREEERESALVYQNILPIIWGRYDQENLRVMEGRIPTEEKMRYIDIEYNLEAGFVQLTEEEKRKEQRSLFLQLSQLLAAHKYLVIFDVTKEEECYDVGFLYFERLSREKGITEREYLNWIQEKIEEKIKFPVSIYVGAKVENLSQIAQSYHTASIARSFHRFPKDENITFYQEKFSEGEKEGMDKQKLDALVTAIEENNAQEIVTGSDHLYQSILLGNMDDRMIRLSMDYLIFHLIHLAVKQDDRIDQNEVFSYISQGAFDVGKMRGSKSHFERFAFEYAKYLMQLRKNTSTGVLQKVEKDIEKSYCENISLKTLSEKYFINSAYLGQIFRKQFGQSFKDYLNAYRIEKAARLLLDTDEKVYNIADMVGYHNLDYFIGRFVSQKGCTPTKYRKQFR